MVVTPSRSRGPAVEPQAPSASPPDSKVALRATLQELLAVYGGQTSLSAWESHCLRQALTLLRYGYYDQARLKLASVLEPPSPLPTFPLPPRPLSLDEVRNALMLV